jgi:hypothetical protein
MNDDHSPRPLAASSAAARERWIERLASPALIGDLSLLALRSVLAFRILALCSKAGREPVAELASRFRSVTVAKSFLEWADRVGRCWPERVSVHPPCCRGLSPDEKTFGLLIDAAGSGDREAFSRAIDGFVRPDRHEPLYAAAVDLAAALGGNDWRSGCPAL